MVTGATGVFPDCPTTVRHITVGTLTKSELHAEFRRHSIQLNSQGETLFAELVDTVKVSVCLETVELTVRQLGFLNGARSAELFARAIELGLSLCPLELAPYLRLHYLDQPEGHWIIVASARPSGRNYLPTGFYLRRLGDGLWLRGYTAAPNHLWDAEDHFVFCR